jgi:hypothetical protein
MDMPLINCRVRAKAIQVSTTINIENPYPFSPLDNHIQRMVVMCPILIL